MGAKILLGMMVAASVFAVVRGSRDRSKPKPVARTPAPETPWLSKDAAAQIVGEDGTPGPLFANLVLGGLAPSAEERARIAAFAKDNRVKIDFEVDDDQLVAIRFDVTYGGCCGYEGAEVLALRARRPTVGGGCMGGEELWVSHWSYAHEDGIHVDARVDHNRVMLRWERTMTTDDVLARASDLLGADTAHLARTQKDRWQARGPQRFSLSLPYEIDDWSYENLRDASISITEHRGRVDELTLTVTDREHEIGDALKARWGRPSVNGSTWTWRKADRVIEADVEDSINAKVTLRRRAS